MSNLRLALRNLVKTPFVTSVAIVSVALGIGANSAIFSLFNQILMRPLPVREPGRLVNLASPGPRSGATSCGQAGSCDQVFSYPMFRDLERVQTVFTGIAAHNDFGASLSWQGQTDGGGEGMLVSGSYFSVLGLQPALGRLLAVDDDKDKANSYVAVLDYEYWMRRFGGRADVLNQAVTVNGQPLTLVGVAPQGFHGTTLGIRPLVYVPISLREVVVPRWKGLENRRSYWAYLFARLKPGVTSEQARASINGQYRSIMNDVDVPLQKGMSAATLERFRARELNLEPGARGQTDLHGKAREPLSLLLGVTGLVLLICCANIANLLLVRGASRSNEMAVRLSIGASRRHIISQLLVESCLLGVLGGICGLIVARWTLSLIAMLLPVEAAETLSLGLDSQVVMFAAALSLGAGVLFGLFPALHSTRPNLVSALKANAGQPSGAKSAARFRMTLATAQIALSMALLISAGLFAKSLLNVTRVDLGLKKDKLVVFSISPGLNAYSPERTRALFERVEDEISAIPGVTGVAASMVRLISGNNYGSSWSVQGFHAEPDTDVHAMYDHGGPDYFRTLGIPLLRGREFTRADTFGTPRVAVVNEAFAKKFNLGIDAVGKRMSRDRGGKELNIEIVGLAKDSKYSEVKAEINPVVVMPYRQDENLSFANFYVRTQHDEQQLLSTIPSVIRRLDPNLPVARIRTMETDVQQNVSLDRFVTSMSAAFAALATLLAAIGLYGVLAYTVTQRTREFGLRMALGADSSNVRALVLRQVAIMTIVGGAIGMASAFALGRVAESLLFQMSARDPLIFTAAAVSLILVAFGAGLFPADRAARVNPMQALRYE
jgi:predicted permease